MMQRDSGAKVQRRKGTLRVGNHPWLDALSLDWVCSGR